MAPALLALVWLAAGCGQTAQVGRTTTVLLVSAGAETPDARTTADTERAIRDRIGERNDLEPANLARIAALASNVDDSSESDDAATIEGQRRLALAEDAFSRFDYAGATTQISEALEVMRPLALRASGRQQIAAVHLQLAHVLLVHGERGAAIEELRTCLHLDPECAPDPARHPPELVALRETAAAANQRDMAALSIETVPPGADVILDGRERATSPHRWGDVPPGRHYVALRRDGFVDEVHVVNVAAGEPTNRRFTMSLGAPSARASAALRALQERGPRAEQRWRREATRIANADVLLALRSGQGAATIGAFDARGEPLGDESEASGANTAVQFLDNVLPPPSVPFYSEWWFWLPVGLGVAGLVGLVTFVIFNVPDIRLVGGTITRE